MQLDTERQPAQMSFEEYLRFDEDYPRPVEYVAGVAYPRHGRSKHHNRINIIIALALHESATCHAFMSLMRVHVAGDTICYPDVVVTCDPGDNDEWTLFHPCLIVEIESPETEEIDRGAKREAYYRMPSLLTYLVVSESERWVERHWRARPEAGWHTELIREGVIPLPCPDVELTVEHIYRNPPPVEEEPDQ
jgi:Uma2 family endonuclease